MQIKLDDDLVATYQQIATDFNQPVAQVIERQLARFADYPSTVRVVPLARDALQQVEKLLGGGQIQSGQVLVDRVRSYASITLGGVVLDFSQAQKEEIVHRAQKRGMTPGQVMQELIDIVLADAFEKVTPYR